MVVAAVATVPVMVVAVILVVLMVLGAVGRGRQVALLGMEVVVVLERGVAVMVEVRWK